MTLNPFITTNIERDLSKLHDHNVISFILILFDASLKSCYYIYLMC